MTQKTTDQELDCGHFRHWSDGVVDEGTGDWESCDECGNPVCFEVDCANGYGWSSSTLLCYPCLDKEKSADGS